MPPRVDSPVQTQLALPVPDGVLGNGRNGSGGICTRPVGRRRMYVQTDSGSVLGIELDRADNVQTAKKKMQTMLYVPTEQTAFVFGDTVLKGDLSELRNDTPLLLTRGLQQSLSTPCLSPSSDSQLQFDCGQPFEVVGSLSCSSKMKRIIKEIVEAIECGVEPLPVSGGLGGAYYFRNSRGESVAIVKPTDEEPFAPNNPKGFVGNMLGQPGLKRAVRVGETGVREVAAYLLDHDHFAQVPPTVLVKVSHRVLHVNSATNGQSKPGKFCSSVVKIASCQQFVSHDFDASDHGTSRFSVSAVHRIGILDIRIFNTDRHGGNILVRDTRAVDRQGPWGRSNVHVNESLNLIPIDHGLCLPEALEDPYFEWLHWPQASLPFSKEELDYISRLDEGKDVDMLQAELPMLREACLRMLVLSTTFLKKAAAAGLCLAEIGEMMSSGGMEEASQLELLCLQAKLQAEREISVANSNDDQFSFGEDESLEQFDFELDPEEECDLSVAANRAILFSGRNEYLQVPSLGFEEAGGSSTLNEVSGNGLAVSLFSPSNIHYEGSGTRLLIPSAVNKTSEREDWPSPLLHYSASPRFSRPERTPLKVLCEGSPLEEEDDHLSSPIKRISAMRMSSLNSGCTVFRTLSLRTNSDVSSPNSVRSPKAVRHFSSLEEDVNVTRPSMASWKIDCMSPRAMSFRSVSLSDRKQRCLHFSERISASETTGKVNVGGSSNPLSLGDMSDEEWALFMDYFQELLQEFFTSRCIQNVSHRQRLGISCQF